MDLQASGDTWAVWQQRPRGTHLGKLHEKNATGAILKMVWNNPAEPPWAGGEGNCCGHGAGGLIGTRHLHTDLPVGVWAGGHGSIPCPRRDRKRIALEAFG